MSRVALYCVLAVALSGCAVSRPDDMTTGSLDRLVQPTSANFRDSHASVTGKGPRAVVSLPPDAGTIKRVVQAMSATGLRQEVIYDQALPGLPESAIDLRLRLSNAPTLEEPIALAQPSEGAPPARLVGPALLIAGFAVLVAVRLAHPYDARHPQVSYVGYHIDQDARQAWRFSNTPARTAWTDQVLKADGGQLMKLEHWSYRHPVDAAPAPFIEEPAPQISLARQADGTVILHAVPPPGARTLMLLLKPDTVVSIAEISGVAHPVALKPGANTVLRWAAAPQGLDVVLKPGGPGKLEVGYIATLERWPPKAKPLPKRPADVSGFDDSDSTTLTGRRSFSW